MPKIIRSEELYDSQQRFSLYRWHIADPIRFERDLKVTIQALGWHSRGRYLPRRDDIVSVAFWYQTEPHQKLPPLPARVELVWHWDDKRCGDSAQTSHAPPAIRVGAWSTDRLLRVAKAARFSYPTDIVVDNAGTVYIADTDNQVIRMGLFPAASTITIQPQSQTVTAGSSVQFPVIHKNANGLMAGQKRCAGAAQYGECPLA